jgi:hypothetical protein
MTLCRVWAPKDETAAEYAMQGRVLKLSIRTPLLRARVVRSSLGWWVVRRWNTGRGLGDLQVVPFGLVSNKIFAGGTVRRIR